MENININYLELMERLISLSTLHLKLMQFAFLKSIKPLEQLLAIQKIILLNSKCILETVHKENNTFTLLNYNLINV